MGLQVPTNPFRKDAEACGRWFLAELSRERKKKNVTPMPPEFVKWIATWGAHWAGRAIALDLKRSS